MNQSFSPEQVIKLLKKSDLIEHGRSKEDLYRELNMAFEKITDGTYTFNFTKNKDFLSTTNLVDKLILRKLNDNIKRLYKDKQANRRIIIYQIKTLLEDECPMWIYRTDISSFYGSIKTNRILEKFKSDSILNFFSINLLEALFENSLVKTAGGLPLGISLSATLSEIYMRPFDRWIKSESEIYYYSRFVDDILIFSFKKFTLINFEQKLDSNLPDGLKRNITKSKHYDGRKLNKKYPLEFLGYKFYLEKEEKSKPKLIVSIAEEKIKKIKTRIILSLTSYLNDKDIMLLENRIKFLTGNYIIRKTIDGHNLKAGIYFNYNYVNDISVFQDLNLFYYRALNSKYSSLGVKLNLVIPISTRVKLNRYSFKQGFLKKVNHNFTQEIMKQIKRCWK